MTNVALPIEFGRDGLVPAVIVDASSGDVLMVGFMNRAAFDRTRETGQVHFWSRSRQKLWRKGESSGHTQSVREIRVNCEENSLLIEVDQVGAVCHKGYATCYYRRLDPDNTLTVIRDRVFDPADVYKASTTKPGLGDLTRTHLGAYRFLVNQPPISQSRTSTLLHADDDQVTPRIADELDELAGVLDGSHRHADPASDAALEAGQVIYWLTLRCVRDGATWDQVRPDRALDVSSADDMSRSTLAHLLRSDAAAWRTVPHNGGGGHRLDFRGLPNRTYDTSESGSSLPHVAARVRTAAGVHATLTLVGQALRAFGVDPRDVIGQDLAELRAKSYLTPYFATAGAPARP